jgi:SAM-dependent methyltransferase
MSPGFRRDELKERYDVSSIREDEWHEYSTQKTREFLQSYLVRSKPTSEWLLNAGSGIYEIRLGDWKEVSVDLFAAPIRRRDHAVCASVERLPFKSSSFGGVVCTGEVLAYCDPVPTLAEFARVLRPLGILVCDFGSSRSFRYWLSASHGRAADLVTDHYNGRPERIWIYEPDYIESLLISLGFCVKARLGVHTWSALARRLGISMTKAMFLQRHLNWLQLPSAWADTTTIVASRSSSVT